MISPLRMFGIGISHRQYFINKVLADYLYNELCFHLR